MDTERLRRVAAYGRTVNASLDRVWENVLDWEHLPWLHRASFSKIECGDAGSWGWRARVGLQPAASGAEILLELLVERGQGRYVARTLDGPGRGTEIWTRLEPAGDAHTHVRVEFHVPGVAAEAVDAVGVNFVRLYARLWDEDEEMMVHRSDELERRVAAPRVAAEPLVLGRLDALRARLPLVVDHAGRRVRIVEIDGRILAHSATCPHMLGPLDDAEVVDGSVECPWHGYRFDVCSGRSSDGRPLRLGATGRIAVDPESGEVQLLPPEPGQGSQRGTRRQ